MRKWWRAQVAMFREFRRQERFFCDLSLGDITPEEYEDFLSGNWTPGGVIAETPLLTEHAE